MSELEPNPTQPVKEQSMTGFYIWMACLPLSLVLLALSGLLALMVGTPPLVEWIRLIGVIVFFGFTTIFIALFGSGRL